MTRDYLQNLTTLDRAAHNQPFELFVGRTCGFTVNQRGEVADWIADHCEGLKQCDRALADSGLYWRRSAESQCAERISRVREPNHDDDDT